MVTDQGSAKAGKQAPMSPKKSSGSLDKSGADGPARRPARTPAISKNSPSSPQRPNGTGNFIARASSASVATAAKPTPPTNSLAPLNVATSDVIVSDFVTETGERQTETASSTFEMHANTLSSEVDYEVKSTGSSVSFEEAEAETAAAPLVETVVTALAAPATKAEKTEEHVGSPPQSKPASPNAAQKADQNPVSPKTESKASSPMGQKAASPKELKLSAPASFMEPTAAATISPKIKVAATAAADLKKTRHSDANDSCSAKISPRSSAEAEGSMSNPNVTSSVSSPLSAMVCQMAPKPSNATRLAQEYRVGDFSPVIVKGHKYVFDNKAMRWKTHDVTVRILHPNRGVDQDNYFAIFSAELLDPIKAAAPVFAKVYRRNISGVAEEDYFSLGQAQALCEEFARDYTRQKARAGYPKYSLPLLTNRVVVMLNLSSVPDPAVRNARHGFFSYRTQDTHQMMFLMEPNTLACAAVGASFASAEVDEGKCYPSGDPDWPRTVYSDIADGFSHFSLVQSRGKMLVHGFLHSSGYLLEPLFHTTDREGFRMGDGGKKAIDEWVKQHRCGDTCRALGIRSSHEDMVDVSAAAAFNPLANQENYYTEYLRCVRQMRVVIRIAIGTANFVGSETHSDFESASATSENELSPTGAAHAVPIAPIFFPVTVTATKYVFLPTRSKWEEVPMRMTVTTPNEPQSVDGQNACFAIEEVHEGTQSIPMRAKFILRAGAKDADYYHVGDAYCTCVALGQVFRSYRKKGVFERELEFRSAYAVRVKQSEIPESIKAHMTASNFFAHTTADSGDVMFVLEPEFTSDATRRSVGAYSMPRDAEGFDDSELRQLVDAFSHFTLHKSGNHLLVCHLKCKDGLLTRPHINTSNGRGYDTLNHGERGIRHWVKHHNCNPLCKLLGMEPLPQRLKLYDISNSRLMTYINLVQQHALPENEKLDFNLPSRPTSEIISRHASEQLQTLTPGLAFLNPSADDTQAAAERSRQNSSVSLVESPVKVDGAPLLRPWVHKGKGAIPNYPAKKNGVLASGPRRPLTQADLTKLQSRGIESKYILPATKYEYDIETLSWRMSRMFVRVVAPERGIGQGGMRVCFEVMDIDPEECEETVMVAKMFRRTIKDVVEKDYFTEVAVQKLSSLFAHDFNMEKKEGCDERVNVLEGAVIAIESPDLNPELLAKKTGFFSYRTRDSQRLMFSVEPRLAGRFTKYNGNMGEAYPTNESRLAPAAARERTKVFEAAEALSHYSLVKSEGGLLVCDMQGVGNDLTDLNVHTYDGKGLGIGNFGARGIAKFVERHRCTSVCKALHLENLRDQTFEVTDEVKKNNKFVRIFERSKEIESMP